MVAFLLLLLSAFIRHRKFVQVSKLALNRFEIFVRTIDDKTSLFYCKSNDSILAIKKQIHSRIKIPVDDQRLYYAGKALEVHRTLTFYGVGKRSTLNLVLNLRGGKM